MMSYISLEKPGEDRFTEKKSVFIGSASPMACEKEALDFIAAVKARESAAKHVAFAYMNVEGNIVRFSDDGEPSGTAGMPILEVMKREKICGAVITVARHFGGILLGAGGLTRAYARAAKIAVEAAGKTRFVPFSRFEASVEYPAYQKLLPLLPRFSATLENTQFLDKVTFSAVMPLEFAQNFCDCLRDLSSGAAMPKALPEIYKPEKYGFA